MMLRRLFVFLGANIQDVVAWAALASITAGCAMERASLGFIVPGAIVLGLLVVQKFRGV